MIILDENVEDRQRRRLLSWRIHVRQIGVETGRKGLGDDDIIPLLHRLPPSTLFTLDRDFWSRRLCHASYCLVNMSTAERDTAEYVRRVLRHPEFNTQRKR